MLKGMWKYVVNTANSIEINLYINGNSIKFQAQVRREVRANQLPGILRLPDPSGLIVVAERIYPDAKQALVTNKIAYIESNGNVFLPIPETFLWVDTNKPRAKTKTAKGRAFTKTGLKVLFHFLLNERFLDMSYRQIAAETHTSPANITNIVNSLKELNYLQYNSAGSLRLRNKTALVEKWIDLFEHRLKPAIEIGTFRFANESDYQNWRRTPLETKKTLWSGEPGGHLLTGMLKPARLTLYTLENRADLIQNYRLERDPDGYIKVYRKFWSYDSANRPSVAPALLVYADLLGSGEVKNIEAADRIFDDVIKSQLVEN